MNPLINRLQIPDGCNVLPAEYFGAWCSACWAVCVGMELAVRFDVRQLQEDFEVLGYTIYSKAGIAEGQIDGNVIATGGGVVLYIENRAIIKKTGISFYLNWTVDVLYERVKQSTHRPLLNVAQNNDLYSHMSHLLNKRQHLYAAADYTIHGDESTTVESIVQQIIKLLPENFI